MTLDQFRTDKGLVAWSQQLLKTPEFVLLLECLREGHPKNYRTSMKGLPISDHAIQLGRIYGYDEFESNLLSAATLVQPPSSTLVPTFEPTQTEE